MTSSRSDLPGPFAPAPLQNLHRYYEPVRPCASRYSAPRGFCPSGSSLSRPADHPHPFPSTWSSVSRRQVLLFRSSACDELTPPQHRTPPGQHAGRPLAQGTPPWRAFVPGLNTDPGCDAVVQDFDASAVVHSRSSSRRSPDPLVAGLFPQSLPTPALDRHDTAAVWAPRLHGEPGGPTSIAGTARSVLPTSYIVVKFLSGHTCSILLIEVRS